MSRGIRSADGEGSQALANLMHHSGPQIRRQPNTHEAETAGLCTSGDLRAYIGIA